MSSVTLDRIRSALEPWVELAESYQTTGDKDAVERTLKFGLVSMMVWLTALTDQQRAIVMKMLDEGAPPDALMGVIRTFDRDNIRAVDNDPNAVQRVNVTQFWDELLGQRAQARETRTVSIDLGTGVKHDTEQATQSHRHHGRDPGRLDDAG